MIGGGEGAFIGAVHRMAARVDGRYQLLAGVFSSDAGKTKRSAAALGVDPARAYPSVEAMIAGEKARADGIEVVSIVTPNHVHYPAAKAFLDLGEERLVQIKQEMRQRKLTLVQVDAQAQEAEAALMQLTEDGDEDTELLFGSASSEALQRPEQGPQRRPE